MPAVTKKNKQKANKKESPNTSQKKFVSESLQKRKAGAANQSKKTPKHRRRGVLYIKHLPHGFYEEQLRGYFSQFGAITRLRLARSSKTLGSKGYAFIEFRYPEVAEIAADAMNNYLMFKNIIKTRFIPPSDIKHDYFRSGVKKVKRDGEKILTSKHVEAREAVVKNINKLMTTEDEAKRTQILGSKVQKSKQKMASLGIDYDVDEVAENMGEEVMEAAEKSKPKTLEFLALGSEDEADETFDPSQVDVDSDDDFEDFEYDSEHTDDDDGIDVNIDGEELKKAVKVAQEAKKSAKIEPVASPVGKKGKRKQADEPEAVPLSKTPKKGKENKTLTEPEPEVVKKGGKKPAEKKLEATKEAVTKKNLKKKTETVPTSPVVEERLPSKRNARKAVAAQAAETKKPVVAKDKKAVSKPEAEVPAAEKVTKQSKVKKSPAKADVPPVAEVAQKKGKKAQPAAQPTTPEPVKKSKRGKKTTPSPQPSPSPAKTKKLAKTSAGIEKKKPVKANVNLKLAAEVVNSAEAADIVKIVKGKDLKGKKKAGSKK